MKNKNFNTLSQEKLNIIQPLIDGKNYRKLQEEAVALIESSGSVYAGTIYQKIREINQQPMSGPENWPNYASGCPAYSLQFYLPVNCPLPRH